MKSISLSLSLALALLTLLSNLSPTIAAPSWLRSLRSAYRDCDNNCEYHHPPSPDSNRSYPPSPPWPSHAVVHQARDLTTGTDAAPTYIDPINLSSIIPTASQVVTPQPMKSRHGRTLHDRRRQARNCMRWRPCPDAAVDPGKGVKGTCAIHHI